MTWTSYRNRGEILRTVIATADARRDGLLPWDVEGVAESFGDELTLLGALQLRWHTRLAGRIERELMARPMAFEAAVVDAWRATAAELPGIRAIVDHHRAEPLDEQMAAAMDKATAKERILLAVMAGQASAHDSGAAAVGARIEEKARDGWVLAPVPEPTAHTGLHAHILGRLKAVKAAFAA